MIWAPAGGFTSALGPTATIVPLSTTTVWSGTKRRFSESNNLTLVKATGVAGVFASDLASIGMRAASAVALRLLYFGALALVIGREP